MLVYNPQSSKIADGNNHDLSVTSLYFDNPDFSLYTRKVEKSNDASSLRILWYGQLEDNSELIVEKKTISEDHHSKDIRLVIKEKYVKPYIRGEYKMERSIQKLQDRKGPENQEVLDLQHNSEEIQRFIKENQLQPVLRANYTRTAFQIPGDGRVRIALDTNLTLIREDSLDADRPCRDLDEWHRQDIDSARMEYPFSNIRKGEIAKFPYAILDIKMRENTDPRRIEWLEDLMASHLVKEAPRFSKYVHGVAKLFEDYINTFPFWLSILETDIRRDPEAAFHEEQDKKAKQAQDVSAVGSFMGDKSASSFRPLGASPFGKSSQSLHISSSQRRLLSPSKGEHERADRDNDVGISDHADDRLEESTATTLRSLFPSFSNSKYAQAHRQCQIKLPPGVKEPGTLIKDMGPVLVEPKVWLANQRSAATGTIPISSTVLTTCQNVHQVGARVGAPRPPLAQSVQRRGARRRRGAHLGRGVHAHRRRHRRLGLVDLRRAQPHDRAAEWQGL